MRIVCAYVQPSIFDRKTPYISTIKPVVGNWYNYSVEYWDDPIVIVIKGLSNYTFTNNCQHTPLYYICSMFIL